MQSVIASITYNKRWQPKDPSTTLSTPPRRFIAFDLVNGYSLASRNSPTHAAHTVTLGDRL
jgi:hypothetical protein